MQASGRAARVLSYLLADNDQSKEMLLPYLADTDSTPGLLSQFLQVMSAVTGAGTNSLHYAIGPHLPVSESLLLYIVCLDT